MKGNCERCELPKIRQRITASKNVAQIANANIKASTSPTEAKPYKEVAEEQLVILRKASKDLEKFLYIWSGTCDDCEYGG